jgi:glycosyltransferase involved in cell wall biosynthesis
MEAAAAGLPIVTTSHCGLPLEDGVSACYVPVGDAHSLAAAIGNLASNQALRETLGRNAMKTVAEECTWRHYGEKLATILEEAKRRFTVRR